MSECLRNGYFPFWLPFQQGGYPLYADVRSTWNPEGLLSAYFLGRTMYALHISLLFYFILAGFGMRQFLRSLGRSANSALLFGLAYPLCGYMVGQAQDIPRIAAAAILPWVLHAWWKMRENPDQFRYQASFALWMHFMLTSGYQALAIVLNYVLLVLFISEVIQLRKQRLQIRLLFQSHSIGYLLFVILSLPLLYSLWESSDYVARFREGVSISQALDYPFSPASFTSFICPWCINLSDSIFATDISMRNGFIGIISLMLSSIGFKFAWKNRRERILILVAIVCCLAALGQYLPIRMWLFNWVPLMKLFKTPAYFILPSLLILFSLASAGFDRLEKPKQLFPHLLFIGVLIIGALILGGWKFDFYSEDLMVSAASRTLLQVGIAALLLSCFLLWKSKILLAIALLLELIIALQIQMPITATQPDSPSSKQTFTNLAPLGFGLQENRALKMNTSEQLSYQDLYRNNALFSKQVSLDGFNSFYFDKLSELEKDSAGYKAISANPLCWLAESQIGKKSIAKKKAAFWTDDNRIIQFKKSTKDEVELEELNPESIVVKANIEYAGMLCLSQTNYPGWRVWVNGNEKEILPVNTGFMGVELPKGISIIEFKFDPVNTKRLLWISAIVWIVLVLMVVIPVLGFQKVFGIVAVVFILGLGVRWNYTNRLEGRKSLAHDFQNRTEQSKAEVWIVTEDQSLFSKNLTSYAVKNWSKAEDFFAIIQSAHESKSDTLLYFNGSARYRHPLSKLVQSQYPEIIEENTLASYRWEWRYRNQKTNIKEQLFDIEKSEFTPIASWQIKSSNDFVVTVKATVTQEANGKLVIHWKRAGKTIEWYGKSFEGKSELKMVMSSAFHKEDEIEIYYWNVNLEDSILLKTQSGLY